MKLFPSCIVCFCFCIYLFANVYAQDSSAIKIQNTKIQNRYVDFFFYTGTYDLVAFRIVENDLSYQLNLGVDDSLTYCFQTSPENFKLLMEKMEKFRKEIETQTTQAVKCKSCPTLQIFWYDGDKERSVLKRAYNIPASVNEILNLCYNASENKKQCTLDKNIFKCFQGFENAYSRPK